jgi:hypothetical protein
MIYHCLSDWKTGRYETTKDFNFTNGISRYLITLERLAANADKQGPWLRLLNTFEVMDLDVQQLLIEDVWRQVQYLVRIL